MNNVPTEKMLRNLLKTCDIIDATFALKLAWLKARHPEIDDSAAEARIYEGILERKEREWRSRER